MLAGSHRNAWPDETGTGGRTNRNTQQIYVVFNALLFIEKVSDSRSRHHEISGN